MVEKSSGRMYTLRFHQLSLTTRPCSPHQAEFHNHMLMDRETQISDLGCKSESALHALLLVVPALVQHPPTKRIR